MIWDEKNFEQLYAIPSKNGLTRPSRVRGNGYKMINMGELFANDRIGQIDMELVPMNDKELSNMLVEPGDLLFARQSLVLAGAGKCSIVEKVNEPTTFESHIIRVRLKRDIAFPAFYYYYFKSPICRIKSIVTQGVQAGIRGNDLKQLQVHVPSVSEQQRIASALFAYDNLIENNQRQIQLLEQAARLLYKEWFVHLRFPGHEHVKIIDGVPEGWERCTLTELAESVSYGLTASAIQEEIGPKFLRITDIVPGVIDWSSVPYCSATEKEIRRNQLEIGDVVVARTGATVGYAKLITDLLSASVYASYLVRFRFQTLSISKIAGIYMESSRYKQHVLNHAGGAAQPNANAKVLGSAALLVPSVDIVDHFCRLITPIFDKKNILIRYNAQLARVRDLMLPRLMNGEISV